MKIRDDYFWSKINVGTQADCWQWKDNIASPYPRVKRRKIFGDKNIKASRYSYYLYHDKWPENCACHHCDSTRCCNPHHLFDGTHSENMNDKIQKGRGKNFSGKGELNPRAKLTSADVDEIRILTKKMNNTEIAKLYGVHHATISLIRCNKNWRCGR